ncbi:MAG: hypothetical protein ACUVX1_16765, partial [Chloroflexota bacterium]
ILALVLTSVAYADTPPGPDADPETILAYKEKMAGCTKAEYENRMESALAKLVDGDGKVHVESSGSSLCDSGDAGNNVDWSKAHKGDILLITNDSGGGVYGGWCHSGTHERYSWVIDATSNLGVRVRETNDFIQAEVCAIERAVAGHVDGDVVRDSAASHVPKPYCAPGTAWDEKNQRGCFYCSLLTWASFKDTYNIDVDSSPGVHLPWPFDTVWPGDIYYDSDNYLVSYGT